MGENTLIKRILAILILGIPFSVAAFCSTPVLLWALATNTESVWRPVGKAMDKLLAALLGFSGDHTLSAELGMGTRMQWLRFLLDKVQKDHCENAAKHEGLK